jgi:hypothetical protein
MRKTMHESRSSVPNHLKPNTYPYLTYPDREVRVASGFGVCYVSFAAEKGGLIVEIVEKGR